MDFNNKIFLSEDYKYHFTRRYNAERVFAFDNNNQFIKIIQTYWMGPDGDDYDDITRKIVKELENV
jgi:hypothetical protein